MFVAVREKKQNTSTNFTNTQMAEKQLNLNAPIYSARRYSSPSHSSELSKPNTIKDKPSLPPSRQRSLIISEYEDDEVTTEPTSFVPFQWEQKPGRPKHEAGLSASIRFHSGEIPKPPSGRLSSGPLRFERSNDQNLLYKPQVEAFSFSDHASLLEKLDESLKCGTESDEDEEEEEEEEEEEGDVYSDALDMLSHGGLQSLNNSMGGISGCHGSRAEPSGTFSVDVQTRDLMMSRFLPAAKAAVLETQTPQYVKKKKSAMVSELPKPVVKKVVSGEVKRTMVNPLPSHSFDYTDDNQENEDEYREKRIPVKKLGKRWGIIPRFCVSNSLCLLNPLPALKPKSRPQTPSFSDVKRLTRKALSGPLDKLACPMPQKKSHSGLLSRELPSFEHKLSKASNIFSNSRDSYNLSTSPLRRYKSGNSSPYRNETPKSPSHAGSGFSSVPKKVDSNFTDGQLASSRKLFRALQDVSRNQKNDQRSSGPLSGNIDNLKTNRSLDTESWRLGDNDEDGYEVKRVIKVERKVESNESTDFSFVIKSPLPPPLPKSPTESWLWKTLPLGNPFSHSNRKSPVCPKDHDDSKWETIVKSTNLHRETIRNSQEHSPRGPKTNHSKGSFMKN